MRELQREPALMRRAAGGRYPYKNGKREEAIKTIDQRHPGLDPGSSSQQSCWRETSR